MAIAQTYPGHPDFGLPESQKSDLLSKLPEKCSDTERQALRDLTQVWDQKVAEAMAELNRYIFEESMRMIEAGEFGVYSDPSEAAEVLEREKRRKSIDSLDGGFITHYMPGSHRDENRVLVLPRVQLQPKLGELEENIKKVRAARKRDFTTAIREIERRYR